MQNVNFTHLCCDGHTNTAWTEMLSAIVNGFRRCD